MLSLDYEKYSRQQIINALHGIYGSRSIDFRFDLLDNQDRKIGDVSHLIVAGSSTIDMDNEAEIHRTAKFYMRDDGSVNFLSDRIQPFVELKMPAVKRKHDDYSLKFNGNENVAIPLKLPNNGTIQMSYNPTEFFNFNTIFDNSLDPNKWECWIYTDGILRFRILTNTLSYRLPQINKRYIITITWEKNGQMALYIDGNLIQTNSVDWVDPGNIIYLGGGNGNTKGKGVANNFEIWSKALTQNEIQNNINRRLTGNEIGLVGLWRLNEGIGNIAKDSTNNGNDGTINGAKWQRNGFEIETIPRQNIEFPLGVFLLSTPSKSYQNRTIYRNIEAYDKLQILLDDGFTARYVADEGSYVTDVINDIILATGITQINIERSDVQLPTWFFWDPDVSRLEVVNQLLQAINYEKIYVDEYGYFTSRPYRSPTIRTSEYEYKTDAWSVISPGATALQDFFAVPNQWVGVISEPDRVPLTYTYENLQEDSPTSIPNRGRTVTKYIDVDAADMVSLQGIVQMKAFEDSQVYTEMTFQTALMPMHSHNDIYHLEHDILGVNAKFQELKWSMTLAAGSLMSHTAREIIPV